jgi:quercetin dioxygenase-like cupin family protein
MKKKIAILAIVFISLTVFAQDIIKLKKEKPSNDFENILVKKLNDGKEQTSFMIWVKDKVKLHKHNFHIENVYVVAGKGEFRLGDKTFQIKKGDYINIPKNTPHAVKVMSRKPLQVLSIQSPKFNGIDRIFIKE